MKENYLIVIGDDPEKQIKKYNEIFPHSKKANWMYDGIFERTNATHEEIIEAIFKLDKFLPSAIIDNGVQISKASLKCSDKSWKQNLERLIQIIDLPTKISCYTYMS